MQFQYHPVDTLPPLAWCARVDKESDTVTVFHGNRVETRPNGFADGAWNGPFEAMNLSKASIVCGTAAALEGDRICFSASTDQVAPLFSIAKSDSLFISNSLIFATTTAGESPDPVYPFYSYDVTAIWRQGLHCSSGELPLQSGNSLRVHFTTLFSVGKDCTLQFATHPAGPAPTEYRSYHDLLASGVQQVFQNAADPARRFPYQPLASVSSGYDSTATAALAAQAGCKKAMTFIDSRLDDPFEDSGADNAASLGMNCKSYERWKYQELGGRIEAEFALFATTGNTPLAALENDLEGHLFIRGTFGDIIWNHKLSRFCENLARCWAKSSSGLSQIEFRLRAGYLPFTPTYIGCRHNIAIHRIINSEEMRPWSIGGKYDRPMPRRIAEEAGVPREQFGMVKRCGGHNKFIHPKHFSTQALENYRAFVQRTHSANRSAAATWRIRAAGLHLFWKLFKTNNRRIRHSTPRRRHHTFLLDNYPTLIPWQFMFTFQWAFDFLQKRYQLPEKPHVD